MIIYINLVNKTWFVITRDPSISIGVANLCLIFSEPQTSPNRHPSYKLRNLIWIPSNPCWTGSYSSWAAAIISTKLSLKRGNKKSSNFTACSFEWSASGESESESTSMLSSLDSQMIRATTEWPRDKDPPVIF
jgi:hypothetical protein